MPPEPTLPGLAIEAKIRSWLSDGLSLTDGVSRYLAATFGDCSTETLAAVLRDPSGAECASFLDLVFFPDTALQVALEPLLEDGRLAAPAVAGLAAQLKADPAVVRLEAPGGGPSLHTTLPAVAVDDFLARLNLLWRPAAELTAAVARLDSGPLSPLGDPADGRYRLLVRLRDAALRQTPVQVRFLCDFFERMPAGETGFVDLLDFMLVFMQEHGDAENLYLALMARKRFLFKNLQLAARATRFAARNNMEILMMTGVRYPHFETAAAELGIARIDAVALTVFGRTEPLDDALQAVDLNPSDQPLAPDDVIRRLS